MTQRSLLCTLMFCVSLPSVVIAAPPAMGDNSPAVDMGWFEVAEQAYPQLPTGLLEAIAWSGSRWTQRVPTRDVDGHHEMPQAWGVMGLYRGVGGFEDTVGQAAGVLGVSPERVARDGATQVMATAALLNSWMEEAELTNPTLEDMVPLLMHLSGLPSEGEISDYAQKSYAYDVLLTLDRGLEVDGHTLSPRMIRWPLAFDTRDLLQLRAPLLNLDVDRDLVEIPGVKLDPTTEHLVTTDGKTAATTDYPPALWVTSPNYSSRSGTTITHIVIHTTQGSYSGAISWFQNPSSQVSAHYVLRSSDGQVTQMVREADKAWHVGSENSYTIGIEHEGYVDTSSYYTEAMYNSSANLTKDICKDRNIDCNTCFPGPATADVSVQSQSYRIKGHQHYPNQNHNDPGQYWNWNKYKGLIATTPGGGTTSVVLDDFEAGEGHFNTAPTYSGSTKGIATSSSADRTTTQKHGGSASEALGLVDLSTSTAAWEVRFLSGTGDPAQNVKLTKAGGRLGFWVYTTAPGMKAGLSIDDSDGTERSTSKTIPTGAWTFLEWYLDDQSQWDAWSGGNGVLDSTTALTLDAIWFYRPNTRTTAWVFVDDVGWRQQ